jgi:hypothetical protein
MENKALESWEGQCFGKDEGEGVNMCEARKGKEVGRWRGFNSLTCELDATVPSREEETMLVMCWYGKKEPRVM